LAALFVSLSESSLPVAAGGLILLLVFGLRGILRLRVLFLAALALLEADVLRLHAAFNGNGSFLQHVAAGIDDFHGQLAFEVRREFLAGPGAPLVAADFE